MGLLGRHRLAAAVIAAALGASALGWAGRLAEDRRDEARNAVVAQRVAEFARAIDDLDHDGTDIGFAKPSTLRPRLFGPGASAEMREAFPGGRMPPNPWSKTHAPMALVATNAFPVHRVMPQFAPPARLPAEAPADPLAAPWLDPRVRQPGTIIYHHEASSWSFVVFGVGERRGRPVIVAQDGWLMNYPFKDNPTDLAGSEKLLAQMGPIRVAIERFARAHAGRYPRPAEVAAAIGQVPFAPNPWSKAGEPMALVATDAYPAHLSFSSASVPAACRHELGLDPKHRHSLDPLESPWLDPRVRRPGTIIYHHDVQRNAFFLLGVAPGRGGKPAVDHYMWERWHADPEWLPVDP